MCYISLKNVCCLQNVLVVSLNFTFHQLQKRCVKNQKFWRWSYTFGHDCKCWKIFSSFYKSLVESKSICNLSLTATIPTAISRWIVTEYQLLNNQSIYVALRAKLASSLSKIMQVLPLSSMTLITKSLSEVGWAEYKSNYDKIDNLTCNLLPSKLKMFKR